MKIGCVKEIKNNEFRVGMTPDNVKSYTNAGHIVYIEKRVQEKVLPLQMKNIRLQALF